MTKSGARNTCVLLVGLPAFTEGLVRRALKEHADIDLHSSGRRGKAASAIAKWKPDVVIVPAPAGKASACHAALRSFPAIRVLEMRGPEGDVYDVRLLASNPGNEAVARAIRAAASRITEGGTQ